MLTVNCKQVFCSVRQNDIENLLMENIMNKNQIRVVGFVFNPIALRKAKIVYNFGLSECNRVKVQIISPLKHQKSR